MKTGGLRWVVAFVVLALGGAAAITAGNVWLPASASSVLRAFLPYGAVSGALAAVGMWLGSRGVPTGARAALATLVLIGTSAIAGSILLGVNMMADASPGVPHSAKIVKKSALSNESRPGDYDRTSLRNTVSVASWLEEGKLIEVHVVGVDRWKALQPGDVIAVVGHDGSVGWPWVEPYGP
jgi:hypothetical protein